MKKRGRPRKGEVRPREKLSPRYHRCVGPELQLPADFWVGTYVDDEPHATITGMSECASEDIREALRQEFGSKVSYHDGHIRFEDVDAWYDHGDVNFATDNDLEQISDENYRVRAAALRRHKEWIFGHLKKNEGTEAATPYPLSDRKAD